jgi:hypothetical protein
MKRPHLKLAALRLVIIAAGLAVGIALGLHTINMLHSAKQATNTTTASTASPAQLAADEAAYKASDALSTQLCNTSDQAKQVEQTALDTYGDTSTQYQTAKATADKAYDACANQLADAGRKSLQVIIDGGTPGN